MKLHTIFSLLIAGLLTTSVRCFAQNKNVMDTGNFLTILPSEVYTTRSSIDGYVNTFTGTASGGSLTNGFYNTGIGNYSLTSLINGDRNVAIGYQSMRFAQTSKCVGLGTLTLAKATGLRNTVAGYEALKELTSGFSNIVIQRYASPLLTTGYENIVLGDQNMDKNNGLVNIAIGERNLRELSSGLRNIAIGAANLEDALNSNNIAIGGANLYETTTGIRNIAMGQSNLFKNRFGDDNIALGESCLRSNVGGSSNISMGNRALYDAKGSYNIAIGTSTANDLINGDKNLAIGFNAMRALENANGNVALGFSALYNNSQNDIVSNVAIGDDAGDKFSGKGNVFLGSRAGEQTSAPTYRGDNNIFISSSANVSSSASLPVNNSAAIGAFARVDASNKYVFGTASTTAIKAQVMPSVVSDQRSKENIIYTKRLGLAFINDLKTATYVYKEDKFNRTVNGLIAQDVQQTTRKLGVPFSGLVEDNDTRKTLNLAYASFTIPLINAVQELTTKRDRLANEVAVLEREVELLESIALLIDTQKPNEEITVSEK